MFGQWSESALLAEMSRRPANRACRNGIDCSPPGRLCQLRMAGLRKPTTQWCIDNWEAVAAEVGAELGVSRGGASGR